MVRDPKAAQRLPRIPETQKAPGVAKITDFTWKQLLNLDACTKCGRCHEACPARAVGAPLSPRDVILSLREFANATLESGTLPPAAELDVHGKSPGQVAMETLWSCRTCMACVEICPVAVEHVPIIVQMRRKLVEDGAMDPLAHQDAADHSQDRQLLRRIEAQARLVDQGAALQGQGRAQGAGRSCCGSSATTPPSIRAIRE